MSVEHARSVLIVEDDDALAGYLGNALRDNGFQIERAPDKAGALSVLVHSDPPQLLLLDLGLPPTPSTMSEGLAVLDIWLAQQPWAKIIVLTGQDEQTAAQEAIRRGAFDFLVKPATLPQILEALRRASLFATQEARMAADGETRLHLTARLNEGPREAAAAAEEQLLRRTLTETGHNIAETGRRLGLAREHVYYYLKKYGIHRPD
jgi:two-component system response regulator RegA